MVGCPTLRRYNQYIGWEKLAMLRTLLFLPIEVQWRWNEIKFKFASISLHVAGKFAPVQVPFITNDLLIIESIISAH